MQVLTDMYLGDRMHEELFSILQIVERINGAHLKIYHLPVENPQQSQVTSPPPSHDSGVSRSTLSSSWETTKDSVCHCFIYDVITTSSTHTFYL